MARLRPCLENSLVFEQAIGLERGRQRDLALPRDRPQGRRAGAHRQGAVIDEAGDQARQLLIAVLRLLAHLSLAASRLVGLQSLSTVPVTISRFCSCYDGARGA